MKLLFSHLRPYLKFLWLALVLATINQVFSLIDPQITRLIIDNYVSKAGQIAPLAFMSGVLFLVLLSAGTAFVSRVAKNFQDYYVNVITQRVSTSLYEQSVKHSLALPYSMFEDQRSGEILQKLQKARSDVQLFIAGMINTVFLSGVVVLFVMIYAFMVHWLVGVAYLVLIPIVGFTTFWITRRIRKLQQTIVAQTTDLAGSTTETLRNVELVKSLGLEEQEVTRLNSVNTEILELELGKIRLVRSLSFIQGTIVNTSRGLLLIGMLWLVANQLVSLGQYFSLLFYSFFVFGPLAELGNVSTQYQETRASLEQLDSILSLPAEPKPTNPKQIDSLQRMDFKNVTFRYPSATRDSVANINLTLTAGRSIALVGPSGSGKSTLIKLLVGLYQPNEGEVQVNGIDNREIDLDEFRKHIGFVSQETQLFASSIRDNLLFVNPTATDEDLNLALEQASATELVSRAPQGLDTKIGEGGIKLSGGERQRLAIARALLRNPELIIFDEATSSLDSITEQSITDTIKKIAVVRPNLMMVLVAHRLSTVIHADTLYVLENGKIVEQGSHDALLAERNLYFALWRQQSGTAV